MNATSIPPKKFALCLVVPSNPNSSSARFSVQVAHSSSDEVRQIVEGSMGTQQHLLLVLEVIANLGVVSRDAGHVKSTPQAANIEPIAKPAPHLKAEKTAQLTSKNRTKTFVIHRYEN